VHGEITKDVNFIRRVNVINLKQEILDLYEFLKWIIKSLIFLTLNKFLRSKYTLKKLSKLQLESLKYRK